MKNNGLTGREKVAFMKDWDITTAWIRSLDVDLSKIVLVPVYNESTEKHEKKR